jgi:hypothetical protein
VLAGEVARAGLLRFRAGELRVLTDLPVRLAGLLQAVRRDEPREAAADDDDARRGRADRGARRPSERAGADRRSATEKDPRVIRSAAMCA